MGRPLPVTWDVRLCPRRYFLGSGWPCWPGERPPEPRWP